MLETVARIAIVGAGLSGRLLALNLGLRASSAVSVRMIDRADAHCMGPAYSDDADYLLLNVPAGRMGVFADDPEHFLKWTRQRGIPADPSDFLPRGLYRNYVFDLLRKLHDDGRTDGSQLAHVRADVTDIETSRDCATIHAKSGDSFVADKVVLALGNFPPPDPPIRNRAVLESGRYVRNPWDPDVLGSVSRSEVVVLVGTGQTTIDLVLALNRRAHRGRIVAISRRGVLPLAHLGFDPYPSFFDEIEGSRSLLRIVRAVRRHFERAAVMGIDERAVIDSLRPHTQTLWRGLPIDEKRRFVRHVFRYWEIIRSRIPPANAAIVDAMRASGQFEVIAGRVHDLVETEAAIEVHYTPRGGTRSEVERGGRVINCIGPETDYRRVDEPLVKNLMHRGLIRPGPANLGLDALPNGAIIGRDGAVSGVLHTIGSPMKGVLWEVLAVPDIRVQAEQLAQRLLEGEP